MVFRFLQESGFVHSAFTFSYESLVLKSSQVATQINRIPPGALITLIQKGLLYVQVEQDLLEIDSPAQKRAASLANTSASLNLSSLSSEQLWDTIAKSQSLRYTHWDIKYDKNRDDENDDDDQNQIDEPDAKRKRVVNIAEAIPVSTGTAQAALPPFAETSCFVAATQSKSGISGTQRIPLEAAGQGVAPENVAPTCAGCVPISPTEEQMLLGNVPVVKSDESMLRTNHVLHGGDDASSATSPKPTASDPRLSSSNAGLDQWIPSQDNIELLLGHTAEVFCCAWHPFDDILASGSGDSTVRLWDLRNQVASAPACNVLHNPQTKEDSGGAVDDDRDVTTLEWSSDGSLLATGCMDGVARLWTKDGLLKYSLSAHSESIFSLRFDDCGRHMLTGSYDKCVSVWDVETGMLRAKFEAHSAQVLDVDWKHGSSSSEEVHFGGEEFANLQIFASCSTDRTVAVCALQEGTDSELGIEWSRDNPTGSLGLSGSCATRLPINQKGCGTGTNGTESSPGQFGSALKPCLKPIQILSGHADEVNAIRWDPSGGVLASCSDDRSVLLWRLGVSTPVRRFRDHTEEIYTIRWSPTGPGTLQPSAPLRLASASFDSTVKLWDIEAGTCAHTLQKHDKKVYTIAFSPSGDLLASGSLGGQVNIWSVKSGTLVNSFVAHQAGASSKIKLMHSPEQNNFKPASSVSADIFEVAWNSSGTRLAATSTNAVTVLEVRSMSNASSFQSS